MKMLFYNFQYCVNFAGSLFDPLGQARGPVPPLEMKNPDRFVLNDFKAFTEKKKTADSRA